MRPSNAREIANKSSRTKGKPIAIRKEVTPSFEALRIKGGEATAESISRFKEPQTHSADYQRTHRSCKRCGPTDHPGRRGFARVRQREAFRCCSACRCLYRRSCNRNQN